MALFKKIFGKKDDKPSSFHQLKVKSLEKNTEDTTVITLEIPEDLNAIFSFLPGQYLTGKFQTKSGEFNRSYSICSNPKIKGTIQVACKKIEGGKVSSFINDELKADTSIEFMKPQGNFILDNSAKKVTAICAGSGITPIMSMIHEIENSSSTSLDLFYGNRMEKDIIFNSAIEATSDRINTTLFLSNSEKDGAVNGRITPKTLEGKIDLNSDFYYLCGPEGLIFSTKDYLVSQGVSENKIKFELFTTPTSVKEKNVKTNSKMAHVEVTLNGDTQEIDVETSKNLLESLHKSGIEAPFSCKGAVCCTCKAKVTEGSAEMSMNMSLTDEEVAEGYILTCQATVTSENIKITYD
jgi:ring-1,2-phenylacetyl-CoA epoxidase subunit PaaE